MQLQTYKHYTVDYRLQQFRTCAGGWDSFGPITFIDFKSPEGDAIVCEMIKAKVFDLSKYNL